MSGSGGRHAGRPEDHEAVREQLGAYALGQLGRGPTRRVRRHLAGCAECRADLAEIAPVAEQLDRLRPDAGGARAGRRARDERRRRLAVRTVALVAAVTVGVVGARALGPGEQDAPPVEAVDLRTTGSAAAATVSDAGLVDHTWGVELVMTGEGFEVGQVYRVRFQRAGGGWAPAGRFLGTGSAELDCRMQSGLLRRDAVAVQVLDADAQPVLVAEL